MKRAIYRLSPILFLLAILPLTVLAGSVQENTSFLPLILNNYPAGETPLPGPTATSTTASIPTATATTTPPETPAVTLPPSENCDLSYPDICIPSPPPDLDCPDILYRDFTVLPPDPHHFDTDNDGIGCESP